MAHGRHYTDAERRDMWRALAEANESLEKLGARLGIRSKTLSKERKRLVQAGYEALTAEPDQPKSPTEERREAHDAAYWRRRASEMQRALAKAEHAVEELGGIRNNPVEIPEWITASRDRTQGRAVLLGILSDLHVGEVIDPDETLNINAYSPEIFQRRLKRYIEAAIDIGPRWAADCKLEGFLLVLGGDLISGDIHEELLRTNALTANEQVRLAVSELTAGCKILAKAFGRVHVVSVPGNHGRQTAKPTAKLYSRLSYDTLAATMIRDNLEGDARFTWQIANARDALVPVLGRTILVTHGDGVGTKGGMGFAGPILPQVRGSRLTTIQHASAGRPFDLLIAGHYHTSSNPGAALWNGSMPGYSEYANGLRASIEAPQQWLALLHSKWFMRERAEIKLEDPATPEKPRVRIAAGMAER